MTDASTLWCPPSVAPVNWYAAILGKLTGGTSFPCILAIRGVKLFASETHETISNSELDDTGILFVSGSDPFLFPLATHPYQARSRAADDGDGDGDGDVATILPGSYLLTLARTGSDPVWVMSENGRARVRCSRDLNHNGRIDKDEAARPFTASAILLHKGAADGRSSIGCQTARLETLQVIARAGKSLPYRLVTAAEAIEAAKVAGAAYLNTEPAGIA